MLRAQRVLDELKRLNVTHVVGLPDNATAALFTLLASDPTIQLITVTREGEAFAIASGLWMGGRNPVVLIQNTGFLESGDALRGTAQRMRIPLLCLINYRGYATIKNISSENLSADDLSRPDVDSAALHFEPTLKAWSLPYDFLASDDDLSKIYTAYERAQVEVRPIALVITDSTQM
jgi:thiamine pyrophosphate-dependent acetolactate synthase large subunit-like protein